MPTRDIDLTEDQDRFVLATVESGRYENAGEVIQAALRSLERELQEHAARIEKLRSAIDQGDTSGFAEPGVFDRVRRHLQLPDSQ